MKTNQKSCSKMMFGIEPGGNRKYYLRQARYYELAKDIASLVQKQFSAETPCNLLDVGVDTGVSRLYIQHFIKNDTSLIRYSGIDLPNKDRNRIHGHNDWIIYPLDLNEGLEKHLEVPEKYFDIVICEQVLEHLLYPQKTLRDIYRLLKPGGTLILGVPSFVPPLHLARKHIVPVLDRIFKVKKIRGHIQAWCKHSFIKDIKTNCPGVQIERVRGFRIISGGILAFLENYRWYWQLNRFIGRIVPSLCIEIQVVCTKPMDS